MNELVILLHGIGMPNFSMHKIKHDLEESGYKAVSIGYPSTRQTIESSAKYTSEKLDVYDAEDHDKIHFVGHSMGGLIALYLLSHYKVPNASRVVTLGTPFGGSQFADWLDKTPFFKEVYNFGFGPAGGQLKTDTKFSDLFENLPANVEVGSIAGNSNWTHFPMKMLMDRFGDHDGVVTTKSAKYEKAKDHITLPQTHDTLLYTATPHIVNFLKKGRF